MNALLAMLLASLATLLPVSISRLEAAPRNALPPACMQVDYRSAGALFDCVGALPSMIYQEMNQRSCSDIARSVSADLRRQDLPTCQVLAEVSLMMTGQAPGWASCLDYPSVDPQAHMHRCLAGFAPGYFGESAYKRRLETCEGLLAAYEQALKASRPDTQNRVPDDYRRLSCDQVHPLVKTLTGREARWLQCAQYQVGAVPDHLLRCLTSQDDGYLRLQTCPAVRRAYEERLRATHGGLPTDYRPLSCSDAQVVLDKAVAEKEAQQQQQRIAAANEAQTRRLQQAAQEQERLETRRAEIRTRQAAAPASAIESCNPGPNLYPRLVHGEILTALRSGCVDAIPSEALLFLGGLAEPLVKQCRLPPNSAERLQLAMFSQTAQLAAAGGSQYSNPDLGRMMEDQLQSQQAYLLGLATFDDLGGGRFTGGRPSGQRPSGLPAPARGPLAMDRRL